MHKSKPHTRRSFMKKASAVVAAAAGFPSVIPSSALGRGGHVAPSDRITVGAVGVGPQGNYVLRHFLNQKDARVVAVCDVKQQAREATRSAVDRFYNGSGCAAYPDFRALLARDDIDVVLVATTDHWHVLVAKAAARAGKDIYLEKPMGLSMAEDQSLRETVHRYGTVFQFGTQQRSDPRFRLACELVRNGRIGKLHTIDACCAGSSSGGSPKPVPVPEGIDYDFWLGPAPEVPYTEDRCSNRLWWFISDYALGFVAGWGVHPLDIAVWGGGEALEGPWEVEGTGSFPDSGVCNTATDWNLCFKLQDSVILNFRSGWEHADWKERYRGSRQISFEGTEGWVSVDRSGIDAHPRALLDTAFGPGDIRLYESTNHVRNLLDCVKTRAKTICPIDTAVRSDSLCHVSEICLRLKRRLEWDPGTERFKNDEEANRRLARSMRSPWRL